MPWPTAPLGEIAEVVSGATPKTSVSDYWGGDVRWVTPADLSTLSGAYIADTPRRITDAGLRSCAAQILPAGSVLLSSRAPIGHVAINSVPMATNQGFKSLVPREGVADPAYLYHWLIANNALLQSLGNGATFKEISKAIVSRIRIPLPPVEEQRRIADILDRADALRAKRRKALALLDDLTQSIFLDMFGDPEGNPCGWQEARLADLAAANDRINYGVVQPGPEVPGGIGLVRVGDLVAGQVSHLAIKHIEPRIEAEYRRSRIRGNEVLVSCVGSVGSVAVVGIEDVGLNIARAVSRIPIQSASLRCYVAEHLRTDAVQRYFASELRTVAQPTLNIKQLANTRIMVPPESLIDRFALLSADVARSTAVAMDNLDECEALFASFQQRAFAGGL